jgi:Crinkler effector protein N-terminal domain
MPEPNLLDISCWILGDEHHQIFSVRISPEATLHHLKQAIKVEQHPKYDQIAASDLALYQITDTVNALQATLENINLENVKNLSMLPPLVPISQYLPQLVDGQAHIIVIQPPSGECKRLPALVVMTNPPPLYSRPQA